MSMHAIADTHFVVVGAGGLGCPALLGLTSAGARTISIIDDDRVEASNLQRQVHVPAAVVVVVVVVRRSLPWFGGGFIVGASSSSFSLSFSSVFLLGALPFLLLLRFLG